MNDSTLFNFPSLIIAASIGTALFSPENIEPSANYNYEIMVLKPNWEPMPILDTNLEIQEADRGLLALTHFINEISSNTQSMDESIQKIVNDNFWEML